jgi:hypothetical protein
MAVVYLTSSSILLNKVILLCLFNKGKALVNQKRPGKSEPIFG